MPTFRAPRGTRDLLPAETPTWTRLERLAADLAARYGYRRIETPLFEQTEVFERGIGEVTDVVEKELFRLAPRTEEAESWALRPEPTAGIVRAYVQHGMQTWPQPVKLDPDRADVPLRPAAGRPLPPVLAVRRRGDRRPGPGGRRRDHRARDALLPRRRARRRRGPAQLDRRRGLPAGLRRRADRLLRAASRGAAGARARPPRAERPAPARFEGSGDGRASTPGAPDHGPAVRGVRRALRAPSGRTSTPSASRTGSSPVSSAASTTTRGPRSSSTSRVARASSRRSAAAVATTGWSSCSAASRRPAIGFGIGLDRLVLALAETGVAAPAEAAPVAVVVGADPDDTVARLRVATELRAAGIAVARRARPAQARQAARGGRPRRRPFRGHPRRRAGRRATSACATCRPAPRSSSPLADLAREIERAHAAHRHGGAEA